MGGGGGGGQVIVLKRHRGCTVRGFRSLFLCSCNVFPVLNNSLCLLLLHNCSKTHSVPDYQITPHTLESSKNLSYWKSWSKTWCLSGNVIFSTICLKLTASPKEFACSDVTTQIPNEYHSLPVCQSFPKTVKYCMHSTKSMSLWVAVYIYIYDGGKGGGGGGGGLWESIHSSGAVWKLRWSSWAPVPNSPYGLCGCKAVFEEEGGGWGDGQGGWGGGGGGELVEETGWKNVIGIMTVGIISCIISFVVMHFSYECKL